MAPPLVFDCFPLDLGKKIHNFSVDDLYVYLTNNTPDKANNKVLSDLPGLATGGGYTSSGASIGSYTWTQTNGLAILVPASDLVFSATGGGFGPFQWAVLYNHTAAAKNLIQAWNNGTPISTPGSRDFTVDFSTYILKNSFP